MFDWCVFSWEIEGNYGVWDDDFRFEVYALGIPKLAVATIDVDISLENNAEDADFIKLPHQDKIEAIARAVKREIDAYHRNQTVQTTAFSATSILCFLAFRPLPSNVSRYYNESSEIYKDKTYHLSNVCLRGGSTRLQDWLVILEEDKSLSRGLSTEVQNFEWAILTFLVVFFPLISLKMFPWGDDLANCIYQKPVNVIKEEAKLILNEGCNFDDEELNSFGAFFKSKISGSRLGINKYKGIKFTIFIEENNRGVLTLKPKRVSHLPAGRCEGILKSSLIMDEMDYQWQPEEMGAEKSESTFCDAFSNEEWIESRHNFMALDTSTPSVFGFKKLLVGKMPKTFRPGMANILTSLRRFISIIFLTCNALVLMMIIDHVIFGEMITRLIKFRETCNVEVSDLGYWNYFRAFNRIKPLETQLIQWDIVYFLLAFYWCLNVFIYSLPGVTSFCIKSIYPSDYFGFFKVAAFPRQHLFGLRLIYAGIMKRMSFIFNACFWSRFKREVFRVDPSSKRFSTKAIWRGFLSVFCVFSGLPIIAIFPFFYSWNKKYWPRAFLFIVVGGPPFAILIFLLILTLKIYLRFIIFSLTALIFHYHVTIGIVSIAAGCLGFLASLSSQVKNCYLRDKIFIHEIISEIHDAKLNECQVQRNKVLEHNKGNPTNRIHVPELIWWWTRENWPCIPLALYESIVLRLRPLGSQRARILFKFFIMGLFLGFIFTVMNTLGMNDTDSVMDATKVLVTAVAVIVPSLIAKLQSSHVKAIILMQKKAVVEEEVERFLMINKTFYNYDLTIETAGSVKAEVLETTDSV